MSEAASLSFFSTVAQCLAALAALTPVFVHFRTQALMRLMIGLGSSMLIRWDKEPAYVQRFVPTLGARRLLDRLKLEAAIEREDIRAVHGLLVHFSEVECRLYRQPQEKGFDVARKHFEFLDRLRNSLRLGLLWSMVFAFLGMAMALAAIATLHLPTNGWAPLLLPLTCVCGAVTFALAGWMVYQGMANPKEWTLPKR